MSKTDKELTTEIINGYISSWNSNANNIPIQPDQLVDIIKTVHTTIKDLG